ncbi:YtxH domain-containing protein [Cesiribacter sp. SM1]|uniref:YtxH domain-containing protein n=1 Tax=Cesiribacter sp. SM1 TaxID=2861196 RepID=UPI001CD6DDA5|nr:YtxH domain-containing protein [Cesiribacter sp. SM1]
MGNSGKFMAFLAGAAAGAAIGLLMAPDKGDVTREKLSRQADDLLSDLEDQWEQSYAKIRDLANNALEEAERLSEQAQQKVDDNA